MGYGVRMRATILEAEEGKSVDGGMADAVSGLAFRVKVSVRIWRRA